MRDGFPSFYVNKTKASDRDTNRDHVIRPGQACIVNTSRVQLRQKKTTSNESVEPSSESEDFEDHGLDDSKWYTGVILEVFSNNSNLNEIDTEQQEISQVRVHVCKAKNKVASDDPNAKHQLLYKNYAKDEIFFMDVHGKKSNRRIPPGFEPISEMVPSLSLADFGPVDDIFKSDCRVKQTILTTISNNPNIDWKWVKPSKGTILPGLTKKRKPNQTIKPQPKPKQHRRLK